MLVTAAKITTATLTVTRLFVSVSPILIINIGTTKLNPPANATINLASLSMNGDTSSGWKPSTFELPTYKIKGQMQPTRSLQSSLVYLDVLQSVWENYRRARLLIYEHARKSRPLAALLPGKAIKLEGKPLSLDQLLNQVYGDESLSARIGSGAFTWFTSAAIARLQSEGPDALSKRVKQVEEKVLSDAEIVRLLAAAKMTLLRLDKELRNGVIKPLKDCMINNQSPNYESIEKILRAIHEEAKVCCSTLEMLYREREVAIMRTELGPDFG